MKKKLTVFDIAFSGSNDNFTDTFYEELAEKVINKLVPENDHVSWKRNVFSDGEANLLITYKGDFPFDIKKYRALVTPEDVQNNLLNAIEKQINNNHYQLVKESCMVQMPLDSNEQTNMILQLAFNYSKGGFDGAEG